VDLWGLLSDDANHFERFQVFEERRKVPMGSFFLYVESLTSAAYKLLKRNDLFILDLLPQHSSRVIETVVQECVEVQQYAAPVLKLCEYSR